MRELFSNGGTDNVSRSRATLLRAGVSVAALACFSVATPAWAQDAATAEATQPEATRADGEIIVSGYRQSLKSAQALKRSADVIVDSVTAEDIGALPDRSVTEALQRIPGVSINRFAAGVDPDHFSVEGSGVVVRGLTYVRSEFNGREAFSANNGRSLSFADVPSEMLGGVDVFKSPSADRIEGGIAGVVNLRTRLPFDAKGLVVAGSLEANYGDYIKKWAPTGTLMVSNRWETPIGEFGLLANFSYSQLKTRSDRFQLSSFRIRNLYSNGDVVEHPGESIVGQAIMPRGAVIGRQEFNRERYGYAAAAQWRSNDGSMEATAQFLRSDARQAWTERTVEVTTDNVENNGDSRRFPGTELQFDSDGMFVSGTITGPTGWRDDQNGGEARTPMMGLQSNNIRRDQRQKMVTDDFGFNLKWNPSDRLGVVLDYQHVSSKTDLLDNTVWASTYQNAFLKLNGNKAPDVTFLPPQVCSGPAANGQNPGVPNDAICSGAPGSSSSPTYFGEGHSSFLDPHNSFYRAVMDHVEASDGKSNAARLDLEYSFPESKFIKSIRGGVRYADRKQTSRFSRYNWGNVSEQWGFGGPVWLDRPVGGVAVRNYEPYAFDNFFRGTVKNPIGEGRLFYANDTISNYSHVVEQMYATNQQWAPNGRECRLDGTTVNDGWSALADRCGVVPGTPFLPDEINPIREQNYAAYLMARLDNEFANGMRLTGNLGLRFTRTDRTSGGYTSYRDLAQFPTETVCINDPNVNGTPRPFCTFDATARESARTFMNNALFPSTHSLRYDYWLPSANLKLEVGNGLQFRAAYFKGVAPPQTGLIRNYVQVSLEPRQNFDANNERIPDNYRLEALVSMGNTQLKPTEAHNFDLTAEWYFSNVGSLTISGFYKTLHGVLTNTTYRRDYTNNGETFAAIVSQPINATDVGKIKGFEVSYQQTFDFLPGVLKGFGLQANYTHLSSSGVAQTTLSATDPDVSAGLISTIDTSKLPLQGLSKHQFNITPFFDYGPISLRASYSWRSDFVLTVRDVITPYDPMINKATGQLDASITFAITPQIKIGVQGANLTNEITRTNAVVRAIGSPEATREVPRGWYMNDRRFSAIARFSF